jgi:zinc transport system substrate-binding protein
MWTQGDPSQAKGRNMKKAALMLVLGFTIMAGCAQNTSEPTGRPRVAATIFPLYDIIRNIAGDKMDVALILPPGSSPHTFELTPERVQRIQGARIIFRIGHGLDDWTQGFAGYIEDGKIAVVDKGVDLISEGEERHEEGERHEHGGVNPHYWLSLKAAQAIAGNVAEHLIELDPANEQTYRDNWDRYVEELSRLHAEIEGKLEPYRGRDLITFHNAFAYYARDFELDIVGTIEPFPGKQPTPRYLAELQKEIKRYDLDALFIEPQLSAESVEAFVGDLGLRVYVLDPLGGVDGRESYIELMRYNTDTIIEAFSDGQ